MNCKAVSGITLFGCIGLVLFAGDAAAYSCTTITPWTTLKIPDIKIYSQAAIGSQIGTFTTSSVSGFRCDDVSGLTQQNFGIKAYGTSQARIGGRSIYQLGNSGIGVATTATAEGDCSTTASIDGVNYISNNTWSTSLCKAAAPFKRPSGATVTFTFYKTGNLTAGTIPAAQLAGLILWQNGVVWHDHEAIISTSSFNLITTGCSVTNTNITVPMGTVNSSQFAEGKGSTAGQRNFTIPVSCDAGTKVSMTINSGASGTFDYANGVVNLDSTTATVAGGVGLQLLRNGTPVVIGSELNIGTATTTGSYDIAMAARYYRSGPITAGQANASATFTIRYE